MDRRKLLACLGSALLAAPTRGRAEPGGVDTSTFVAVPGARLYLDLRGRSRSAPLLIWLHGGPGGTERPLFRLYNAMLEEAFVVAYYDQRGAGRSFDPKADPSQLTIRRHVQDLRTMILDLRRRLGGNRVVLLGHSWGSALGLLYLSAYPQDVAGFIGVGQLTSERDRQHGQFDFVRAEAERRDDREVLARLARIGPPPFDASRELEIQHLVDNYGGYWRRKPSTVRLMLESFAAGLVSPWEIGRFIHANNVSLRAMNDDLLTLDLPATVKTVAAPVVFLLGRHDRQVDSRLAAAYFEQLQAPYKELVWFENSAHNIPFEEPAAFNAAIVAVARRMGAFS